MSTKNDNNSMVILGASAIALLGIFGIYSTMNEGDYEEDDYDDDEDECDYERWESRNVPMVSESYCGSGNSVKNTMMTPPVPNPMVSESYCGSGNSVTTTMTPAPVKPLENFDPSPLGFSTMAGGSKEGYNFENNSGLSDYVELKNFDSGSQNIPIYNELDGQVGLPVPDMTDISAGENNKYVYDRTIGTIGFTSTKIGGRRRGQADYVRGDLAIIPDRNTNFQVSADPLNSLQLGAMNQSNGIGESYRNSAGSSQFGAQRAASTETPPMSFEEARNNQYKVKVTEAKAVIIEKNASSNQGQNAADPKRKERINEQAANAVKEAGFAPHYGGVLDGPDAMQRLFEIARNEAVSDNRNGQPTYIA